MSGWILTTAEWTGNGAGTASPDPRTSDSCIDILDLCKTALMNNSGAGTENAGWIAETTTGYTGRLSYGSDDAISYGYYFQHGTTGAKLCMIYTFGAFPFSKESYVISYSSTSTSKPAAPIGLCLAMIPPNSNNAFWNTPDWTDASWLPDIGMRLTGPCFYTGSGAPTNSKSLAYYNTKDTKYRYWFLCKQDTLCVLFRASDWQYQPWDNVSQEHTRGVILGNIFETTNNNYPHSPYGTLHLGGSVPSSSPYGRESLQETSTSSIQTMFSNGTVLAYLAQQASSPQIWWQCYNTDGVLCLARGAGLAKNSTDQGSRSADIKTYCGSGIFPILGSHPTSSYVSMLSSAYFYDSANTKTVAAPFAACLHIQNNPAGSDYLNDDFPGIANKTGFKGFIRKDLLLGISNPSPTITCGSTLNNGDYICVAKNGVLLGWDSSNENIFAAPPSP